MNRVNHIAAHVCTSPVAAHGSFTDAEFQNDPLYVPFRVLSPLELHRAGQCHGLLPRRPGCSA